MLSHRFSQHHRVPPAIIQSSEKQLGAVDLHLGRHHPSTPGYSQKIDRHSEAFRPK
jgi:hypothetical protein